MYVKPKNEIFTRHKLATHKQQQGESIDEFLQALRTLSKDCNFKQVTAEKHCEESIRDAFISGLTSNIIRQRLLENETLTLSAAYDQARSLDSAQKQSEQYQSNVPYVNALPNEPLVQNDEKVTLASVKQLCYFCGNNRHPRSKCPARTVQCNKCQKLGHFAKVCRSSDNSVSTKSSAALFDPILATVSVGTPSCLSNAVKELKISGYTMTALIDTGSSENFISKNIVELTSNTNVSVV